LKTAQALRADGGRSGKPALHIERFKSGHPPKIGVLTHENRLPFDSRGRDPKIVVRETKAKAMIRIEQIRHQKRAFDLVSVTIRTISSRSSPDHPGADLSNEAAVDRRPSSARDRDALAMRERARDDEDFRAGFSSGRFRRGRCSLL